ncbi:protein lzic [Holotrichia oblita]|uniref:Protein lzic n=1 Tax=Holotrichia oblita TaxID=644536 RepID=A0ACB9TEM4_HOLOL|nr:protein lzic [Holotrichia oblita]
MTSRARGKAIFDIKWVNPELNDDWSNWLEPFKNSTNEGWCRLCKKTFSLSNMGRQAVISHQKSKKHQLNITSVGMSQKIHTYTTPMAKDNSSASTSAHAAEIGTESIGEKHEIEVIVKENSPNVNCPSTSRSEIKSTQSSLTNFVNNDKVTTAEILFCLNVVINHMSLRAAESFINVSKLAFF